MSDGLRRAIRAPIVLDGADFYEEGERITPSRAQSVYSHPRPPVKAMAHHGLEDGSSMNSCSSVWDRCHYSLHLSSVQEAESIGGKEQRSLTALVNKCSRLVRWKGGSACILRIKLFPSRAFSASFNTWWSRRMSAGGMPAIIGGISTGVGFLAPDMSRNTWFKAVSMAFVGWLCPDGGGILCSRVYERKG